MTITTDGSKTLNEPRIIFYLRIQIEPLAPPPVALFTGQHSHLLPYSPIIIFIIFLLICSHVTLL